MAEYVAEELMGVYERHLGSKCMHWCVCVCNWIEVNGDICVERVEGMWTHVYMGHASVGVSRRVLGVGTGVFVCVCV
jgi:hypothetical protein